MATHTLNLSNAAAIELANLSGVRGLLAGKSRQKSLAGRFIRDQVIRRGLPERPTADALLLTWSETPFATVENVPEITRDALKALVRDADAKGVGDCGAGFCDLLDLFGLSEGDQPPA